MMDIELKKKSITMAEEINEAITTLDFVVTDKAEEREIVEAKNIVAGVLRNYKSFINDLAHDDQVVAQRLFTKKIETLALKARQLLS